MQKMKAYEPSEYQRKLGAIAIELLCEACELAPEELLAKRRHQELVQARAVAMYLLSRKAGIPLTKVGAIFGGKDHSTVIHACRLIDDSIALNGYGRPYEPRIARILSRVEPQFLDRMRAIEGEAYYECPQHHLTAGYI